MAFRIQPLTSRHGNIALWPTKISAKIRADFYEALVYLVVIATLTERLLQRRGHPGRVGFSGNSHLP